MSKLKRGSDRSDTSCRLPMRLAAACAAFAVLPFGSTLAQQTQIQTNEPAAMAAPGAAVEDHSAHSGVDQLPAAASGDSAAETGAEPSEPAMSEPPAAPDVTVADHIGASAASSADPLDQAMTFLQRGGPAIWSIALLSVVALALILWKIWRLAMIGAWTGGRRAQRAVALWSEGREQEALDHLQGRRTCRAILVRTAMAARRDRTLDDEGARAETERVARKLIVGARAGLRPLELISTIAPLLGLLGTVLGMIAAFQALQEAGSRADPAILAGGIWEALLTTAAGMAVAIPASMGLTWFESVVDRLRQEMEDAATRIFLRPIAQDAPQIQTRAAE